MAAVFMAAAFTAVSVAEALVTGASEATDFGLVGFSEALIPATMAAYYPGHYGYGPGYLTVYGTTYCY
jgi:hypothetical protein